MLRWLRDTEIPVPDLHSFGDDHFITRKLPGQSLRDNFLREQAEVVVTTLAHWFGLLHSYTPSLAAADRGIDAELADARQRSLSPDRMRVWTQLQSERPVPGPATLTHGDPWPCNFFFEHGVGIGIIDWARGGIGPPERDLAILERALTHHYGPPWAERFWQLYGKPKPDRLDWFLRLHSFF